MINRFFSVNFCFIGRGMEEVLVYKALYNYSPSDDELTEGYIAVKTDDVLEVKKSDHLAAECGGNIQV